MLEIVLVVEPKDSQQQRTAQARSWKERGVWYAFSPSSRPNL